MGKLFPDMPVDPELQRLLKESEKWPPVRKPIKFETADDAHMMADILNEIYGQLEGMWEHVRALENRFESHRHDTPDYPQSLMTDDFGRSK